MDINVNFKDPNIRQKTARDFSSSLKFSHLNSVKTRSTNNNELLSDIKELIKNGLIDIYGDYNDLKYRYIVDLIIKRVKTCLNDLSLQSKKDIQTELEVVKQDLKSEITSIQETNNKQNNQSNNQNNNISSKNLDTILTIVTEQLDNYYETKSNDFSKLLIDLQENISEDVKSNINKQINILNKKNTQKNKEKEKTNKKDNKNDNVNKNISTYINDKLAIVNRISKNMDKNFSQVNRNINATNLNITARISKISGVIKSNIERSIGFISKGINNILKYSLSPIKGLFNLISFSFKKITGAIKNIFKFILTPEGMYITLITASVIWKVFREPILAFYNKHLKPTVDKIKDVINDPTKTIWEKIKESVKIFFDDIIVNKLFASVHNKIFKPLGNWMLNWLSANKYGIFKALGISWLLTHPIQAIQLAIAGIGLFMKPIVWIFRRIFPNKLNDVEINTIQMGTLLQQLSAELDMLSSGFDNDDNDIDDILPDDGDGKKQKRRREKRKNRQGRSRRARRRGRMRMRKIGKVKLPPKITRGIKIKPPPIKHFKIPPNISKAPTIRIKRMPTSTNKPFSINSKIKAGAKPKPFVVKHFNKVNNITRVTQTSTRSLKAVKAARMARMAKKSAGIVKGAKWLMRGIRGAKYAIQGVTTAAGAASSWTGVGVAAAVGLIALEEAAFYAVEKGVESLVNYFVYGSEEEQKAAAMAEIRAIQLEEDKNYIQNMLTYFEEDLNIQSQIISDRLDYLYDVMKTDYTLLSDTFVKKYLSPSVLKQPNNHIKIDGMTFNISDEKGQESYLKYTSNKVSDLFNVNDIANNLKRTYVALNGGRQPTYKVAGLDKEFANPDKKIHWYDTTSPIGIVGSIFNPTTTGGLYSNPINPIFLDNDYGKNQGYNIEGGVDKGPNSYNAYFFANYNKHINTLYFKTLYNLTSYQKFFEDMYKHISKYTNLTDENKNKINTIVSNFNNNIITEKSDAGDIITDGDIQYHANIGSITNKYNTIIEKIKDGNGIKKWNKKLADELTSDYNIFYRQCKKTEDLSIECIKNMLEIENSDVIYIHKIIEALKDKTSENMSKWRNKMFNAKLNFGREISDRNEFEKYVQGGLNYLFGFNPDEKETNSIYLDIFGVDPNAKLGEYVNSTIENLRKIYHSKFNLYAKNNAAGNLLTLLKKDDNNKYNDELIKFVRQYIQSNNINFMTGEIIDDNTLKKMLYDLVQGELSKVNNTDETTNKALTTMKGQLVKLGNEIKESTGIIDASTAANNSNNKARSKEELTQWANEYLKNNVKYNKSDNY